MSLQGERVAVAVRELHPGRLVAGRLVYDLLQFFRAEHVVDQAQEVALASIGIPRHDIGAGLEFYDRVRLACAGQSYFSYARHQRSMSLIAAMLSNSAPHAPTRRAM